MLVVTHVDDVAVLTYRDESARVLLGVYNSSVEVNHLVSVIIFMVMTINVRKMSHCVDGTSPQLRT